MAQSVAGSFNEAYPEPAKSVAHLFVRRVEQTPNAPALMAPTDPGWKTFTWGEVNTQVRALAAGLVALGVKNEERVGIASNTNYQWVVADLAIMLSGAATTTVYPSTGPEDTAYILADSDTVVVFAEDDNQIAKLQEQRANLPALRKVVTFTGTPDGDWVIGLQDLGELGVQLLKEQPSVIDDRIATIQPDSLATLIYTSGTTGKPKGVQLLHSNWTYEAASVEALGILTIDDVQFLWLPLAHSFGKVLEAIMLQVGFVTAVDGRVPKIVENLGTVKPTFMAAVPRIFEKVHAKVTGDIEHEGGAKKKIFDWAFGVGMKAASLREQGKTPGALLAAQLTLADKLVFSKIKDRMGGRIRYFVSGSAALSQDINSWFRAAGLAILEGYGLTETSAASTLNRPGNAGIGTVGEPFPGTEIHLAEDGEILISGPGIMRGYHNLPEATVECFTEIDGRRWFKSGDIGQIDNRGRVSITDRKKDLVKTSGGKFIAPSAIESHFKSISKVASFIVIEAADRNFVSALVAIDIESGPAWAHQVGAPANYDDLVKSDILVQHLRSDIQQLNKSLNKWETVKKFTILPTDLTVESGELTPSLKIKRKVVSDRYKDLIDAMYKGSGGTDV
jgi:long-chain acyl-CoA synthetase